MNNTAIFFTTNSTNARVGKCFVEQYIMLGLRSAMAAAALLLVVSVRLVFLLYVSKSFFFSSLVGNF
jgi:hypothetical protein